MRLPQRNRPIIERRLDHKPMTIPRLRDRELRSLALVALTRKNTKLDAPPLRTLRRRIQRRAGPVSRSATWHLAHPLD